MVRVGHEFDESSGGDFGSGFRATVGFRILDQDSGPL